MMKLEQFSKIVPANPDIFQWFEQLEKFLPEYDIITTQRIAAFISICVYETGGFRTFKDSTNYKLEYLRSFYPEYFPTDEIAKEYQHLPAKIANLIYAGKLGNGPPESKDGWTFRGQGLIRWSGRTNFQDFADHTVVDIKDVSNYLVEYDGAVKGACWYWKNNGLNELADIGDIAGIASKQPIVLGIPTRISLYRRMMEILSIEV